MAKPIKASIFNEDRTLSIYYIKQGHKIGPNAFKLPKLDEAYIIDADYAVTTKTKKMFVPFRYTTYYYVRNNPRPLPVPKFEDFVFSTQNAHSLQKTLLAEPEYLENDSRKKLEQMVKVAAPKIGNDKGISSQELGKLFNPQFYTMIAKAGRSKKEDLGFMIQVGTACGVAFLIYYVMQLLPNSIGKALGVGG